MSEDFLEDSSDSILAANEWLCGLALKRFENADKVFDVLNNRAGLLIGYSGIFSPFVVPALQRLPFHQRQLFAVLLILSFILTAIFSLRAMQVVEVNLLPLKRDTANKYLSQPLENSQQEFLSNLLDASERNEKANLRKAHHLRISIICIGLQVLISLIIILFSTV